MTAAGEFGLEHRRGRILRCDARFNCSFLGLAENSVNHEWTPMNTHDVRHTGISWVDEHYGLKAAQEQAGHKQQSTTANFYVHLRQKREREIAASMGRKVLSLATG